MSIYDQYETVIGLEIHVQLATKSKAFCSDDTTFGASPNTHVSTISLGHPGTLPKLNKKQIEYAVKLGLALGSEISLRSYFDRKNYFYTDLPKGYQITQDRLPICIGGFLDIRLKEGDKKIRIHHIHMEEDAGKSIHDQDPKNTLVDLNRAGVPLLEIVSEPDLRSAEEVDAFMSGMRQLVRYLEVSDGNMQEGSMRCDVNVSVRKKGETAYGQRCEIKNLNSMRYARKAIEFEVKRQIDLIESGGKVDQETLNFNPSTGRTTPIRDKENAHDYRYFPEPDLPPVVISKEFISDIQKEQPPLPLELYYQFQKDFNLSEYDANLLTEEKQTALFFLDLTKYSKNYKAISNLIINKINPYLSESNSKFSDFPISKKHLAEFIQLIDESKVSNSMAYQRLFPEMLNNQDKAPLELAEKLNLIQSSDTDFLEKIVDEVLAKNPDKVATYKKGKKGLIGFFMGEVMRASKGKADPKKTNGLLAKKLNE